METFEDYEAARIIGNRIRAHRRANDLTLETLSYLSETHVTTVSRIERGRSLPNLGTLMRLATVLNVDPGSLIHDLHNLDFSAQQ
ncbi:helix-turn-helix domain-containing protein [Lysinibacter cavernae]|uniref:Transcriptional regulator with XRE-family HTH domain n=1 Tax=Lysinibacter cavernae TaxID=1640652 RepID=A0A7X5TUI8_9MICO|nr:helix-turn-helix transcriptional regulator [Lysinibacter cavernae]NIH54428.1 transcriptional regulator with XRE-family HTH domain [Lysinibacter cavernae]